MLEETPISLNPINFFQLRVDCPYQKRTHLPDTSSLCNEIQFSDVGVYWDNLGLTFYVQSKRPFQKSLYPNIQKGDSFEVMIDTRDMKEASFNTRFCHHFFCLPEETDEGFQSGEITHFRTEDAHDLCNPKELKTTVEFFKKGYALQFFIPKSCLHGYDPETFNRLGFTYCINSFQNTTQHFSLSKVEYQIEKHPSLWATLRLVK